MSKISIKSVSVFIALLLIAGGAVFYLFSKTLTPASDQTANWKTYTNTNYGFEFKYPQKLSIRPSRQDQPYMIVSMQTEQKDSCIKSLWITQDSNPQILSLQEYFKLQKQEYLKSTEPGPTQNFPFEDFSPITTVNIADKIGYQFIMPSPIEPLTTIVGNGHNILYIYTGNVAAVEGCARDMYLQILSAFKFLE